MIYEKIDLYDYFSLPREGKTGGVLTVVCRSPYVEIKEKIRPAMLVIAGGGYFMVSEREAEPIALHFLLQGYAAFSLKYSVQTAYPVPLLEAAMAMAFIRENAEKYGVDTKHVGAVGFSAGGHLTAMLGNLFADPCVKETLGKRAALVRPDAVLLAYPVISGSEFGHSETMTTISGGDQALRGALSLETRVTKQSSPAFIWHTVEDD
ncbi:MAG: alpha/beta hydrolase, partial [Clostridia bacterium]|nr:alpha/beta hydrolase [Clostridia bacterium]